MTDIEFKALIDINKVFTRKNISLPMQNDFNTYDLKSVDTKDKFYLDIDRRGKIELKTKLQNRYCRNKLPLVRIDFNSPPYINPDGTKVSRNHIHIFKETDNDTGNLPWAYELDDIFNIESSSLNFMNIFNLFCKYCNIDTDKIQGVL